MVLPGIVTIPVSLQSSTHNSFSASTIIFTSILSVCSKVAAEVIVILFVALTLTIWQVNGETVQFDRSIPLQSAFWKVKGFVTLKKNSTGLSLIVKSSHIANVILPVNLLPEHETLHSNTQILA